MKKLILISFLINLNLFALSSDIKEALAVGVFHEDGTGEKVQHKRITDENYDGTCFSKIVVIGKIENKSIKVPDENAAVKNMKKRLIVSIIFLVPLLYISMGHMIYDLFSIKMPYFMETYFA